MLSLKCFPRAQPGPALPLAAKSLRGLGSRGGSRAPPSLPQPHGTGVPASAPGSWAARGGGGNLALK